MLVSSGQRIMRIEVTYGVSRIEHAGFCCVRCCLFQATSILLFCFFHLPFPLSLVVSVSIGLVSISIDFVSVTVPGGWWPLAELPWRPVYSAHGLWLKARCLPRNPHPLWQAPSPSSSIGDEFNVVYLLY